MTVIATNELGETLTGESITVTTYGSEHIELKAIEGWLGKEGCNYVSSNS